MTPYTEYLRRVIVAVESLPPEWRGAVFCDAPGLGGSFRLHAKGEPLSGATWARRAYDTGSYPAEWSVTLGDVTVFGCATA